MNQCPGCGYIVPGSWTECRRCGTPVSAPVASVAATSNGHGTLLPLATPQPAPPAFGAPGFGAPDDALIPGARPRGVVPDTMLPNIEPTIIHAPPSATSMLTARNVGIAIVALLVTIAGVYSMIPDGHHAKAAPTILAPLPPAAGLPTSLSAVVRIAAESARHTALATVMATVGDAGTPVTLEQLKAAQPSYQWIPGNEPSTTNTVVSITSGPGIDTIAVSGTDKDICAFGRWSATFGSDYVTMAHVTNCAATNAPTTGWTSQPGGSAQDLPSIDGT
jgi:hypothetical protein